MSREEALPLRRTDLNSRPSVTADSTINDNDINILLMGQSGMGKSTCINALFSYLVHETLEEAETHDLTPIIPSSFTFYDEEMQEDIQISVGDPDKCEQLSENGYMMTQHCRSFLFPIGKRRLRIIDTPGIADQRGPSKDDENIQEILRFIAQFDHLNAICILFKPDEQRMSIIFRFCFNEILRRLHVDAKNNIIFLFTFARTTFYKPGNTKRLINDLLKEHFRRSQIQIPFNESNTFLVDNESFRYLALRKNGRKLPQDQVESFSKSWTHSAAEYRRLIRQVVQLPVHRVHQTISLNEAEQIIRKLPRPIAETQRLIEENIMLAQHYKRQVLENSELLVEGLPQNMGRVLHLNYPRTVCTSDKCRRITNIAGEARVEYSSICHDHCYLKGVAQETLDDQKIADCEVMNWETGFCTICGCFCKFHKHITYEYINDRTYIGGNQTSGFETTARTLSLNDIDRRISALRSEAEKILAVYKELVAFYRKYALVEIDDVYEEYLKYFIDEESHKQKEGVDNAEVIAKLQKHREEYLEHMKFLKSTSKEAKASSNQEIAQDELESVFALVRTLYDLPITGRQIREQVEGITFAEKRNIRLKEQVIQLSGHVVSSTMMQELAQLAD